MRRIKVLGKTRQIALKILCPKLQEQYGLEVWLKWYTVFFAIRKL
jgi:hypothetical protein